MLDGLFSRVTSYADNLQGVCMKYNVCRYFDDVFEKVIESFDNKEEAEKKANELNNSVRAYVAYLVREEA